MLIREGLAMKMNAIIWQETQNGEPAKDMASAHPNPMLNAHQDWLNGLVSAVRKKSCVAV